MADRDHETGVGPHPVLLDPIENGVHRHRRPEQPQRLINQVTTKITASSQSVATSMYGEWKFFPPLP